MRAARKSPEMLALDHIPPRGPARGASPRSRGASGVPRGVVLRSPELRTTPLAPQKSPMQPTPVIAVWLTPAHPDWSRAAGLPPLARTGALRGRRVSSRRSSIGGPGVRQPEVRLVLQTPVTSVCDPHEPPNRCDLLTKILPVVAVTGPTDVFFFTRVVLAVSGPRHGGAKSESFTLPGG